MTAIYSTESCLDCKFWKRGDIYGECRRFPISENKHQNSWCGEYYSLTPSKNEPKVELKEEKKLGRPAKVKV